MGLRFRSVPAPLIIFSTFVGYIGGGLPGAVVITVAIFAPAFAFTMIGHEYLERLVDNQSAHAFLDGVTAGVVGLIGATALGILSETIIGIHAWIIFSTGRDRPLPIQIKMDCRGGCPRRGLVWLY